ncbi:c-type cytochrome biogenesis protein CcmI [Pseudomonas typographi]|uniref:c-type cytochrome biogenesis protein CcmI n=1 Tax=Pseudomonas typographi TaxID=2715964 RepID=UPI001688FC5C|nr:c-type cytochrome biogenesis protein CcmI [Pseudomonas typographi]MBD1554206.1 c-type cytochrome biogenesis protein CcmI [Pseudomonas typographi]
MTDFWLATALLLGVAMCFILLPLLLRRPSPAGQDRAALNVALFEERAEQLHAQHADGLLSAEDMASGRAEAARELLADADGEEAPPAQGQDWRLPLLVAFVLPVLALGLYLHYGASDTLALSRSFATPPQSLADMTARLEQTVKAQPDAVEGVYYLARTYMAQNRPGDAAPLFERAVALAGRRPDLLGQWAQALYFANGKHWGAPMQALTDEALKADPNEVTSLGLLGIAGFESQHYAEAAGYWQRLQALLPAGDPARQALQGGIDKARQRAGLPPAAAAAAEAVAGLKVQVSLAPALRDKVLPGDTVFVFARAVNGPPLPLAVKRLTVAELPATVELSDADAMQPALKLSAFEQVQLGARISRSGQPTQGEWLGRGAPIARDSAVLQQLTIDSPDS